MSYLLVGALLLALWFLGGRRSNRDVRLSPQWRVASAATALGVFIAAGFVGLGGGAVKGLELALVGAVLLGLSRWPRPSTPSPEKSDEEAMSLSAARDLLGVRETATPEEIQAAYARLMRRAHPDHGGSVGLATQLNLARERLLKR